MPLSLSQQGYPHFSGYGWYRLKLYRNPHTVAPDLRLALSGVSDVGAFFANGIRFGQFGEFPPEARLFFWHPMSFPISSSRWRDGYLLLAIRIWADPKVVAGVSLSFDDDSKANLIPPTIGSPQVIKNLVDARKRDRELNWLPAILAKFARFILALYLFGFYFTENRRPEYLWLGLNFVGDALYWLIHVIAQARVCSGSVWPLVSF